MVHESLLSNSCSGEQAGARSGGPGLVLGECVNYGEFPSAVGQRNTALGSPTLFATSENHATPILIGWGFGRRQVSESE